MAEFKVGDVVKLKSGGPRMTIQTISKYRSGIGATCKWFDKEEAKKEVFSLEALEIPKKIQI